MQGKPVAEQEIGKQLLLETAAYAESSVCRRKTCLLYTSFIWAGIIKSLFFAFIIASVSAFFGYTVDGGSIAVGKASTDAVVSSSVLILFADLILTKLLMG